MPKTRKRQTVDNCKNNPNLGKKFVIFVKKLDENGFVDESNCGWLNFNNQMNTPELAFSFHDGQVFTEMENGHGSFEDWKNFFEEEHPDWKINSPPKYLD